MPSQKKILAYFSPIPTLVVILGLGGLIPFVGLCLLIIFFSEVWYAFWLSCLLQYGAVILSFVGALQWGVVQKRNIHQKTFSLRLIWGVMPALIAWMSFQFPVWTGLRIQAVTFMLCYCFERFTDRVDSQESFALDTLHNQSEENLEWTTNWMTLRIVLTTVASFSLLIASYY